MAVIEIERSLKVITNDDLRKLYEGSAKRLGEYFVAGQGRKWLEFYDIEKPLAVALCQGGAMHYHDKENGVKDFDVWFFFPFNKKHLPYRTIWNWDYRNPKFGHHPSAKGYQGRKVDVLVRSIHQYAEGDPVKTILRFLKNEKTSSSRELAKKAVVMLSPDFLCGKVVWYKGQDLGL
jgi:hypothetical protein